MKFSTTFLTNSECSCPGCNLQCRDRKDHGSKPSLSTRPRIRHNPQDQSDSRKFGLRASLKGFQHEDHRSQVIKGSEIKSTHCSGGKATLCYGCIVFSDGTEMNKLFVVQTRRRRSTPAVERGTLRRGPYPGC